MNTAEAQRWHAGPIGLATRNIGQVKCCKRAIVYGKAWTSWGILRDIPSKLKSKSCQIKVNIFKYKGFLQILPSILETILFMPWLGQTWAPRNTLVGSTRIPIVQTSHVCSIHAWWFQSITVSFWANCFGGKSKCPKPPVNMCVFFFKSNVFAEITIIMDMYMDNLPTICTTWVCLKTKQDNTNTLPFGTCLKMLYP